MTPVIGHYGGYRKTLSFGLTCLVYHATTTFCRRNYNYQNDALGKTVGQMVGAARSARQNIVEGSSRAGTSKETELKLLDVAKASLQELAGDYEAFIVDAGETPWSERDPKYLKTKSLSFDDFSAKDDLRHEYGAHLLEMRKRFASALENEDPIVAANAILVTIDRACALLHRQIENVTIDRACALLHRQIEKIGEDFREQGGFTEHLTNVRLEARDAAIAASDAPKCPKCGGPMRKVVAKKGSNAGNPFWSCQAYPNCTGTRKWEWK